YGKLKFSENRSFNKFQTKQAFYFSLVQPKKISNKLLKSLKVSASNKLATIIDLSLRDAVPRRAEDILNELINAYNQAAITDKNTLAANTLAFVDDRLNAVTHELDSIERAIQKFKSGSGAIDISTQGKLFLQNVSENDQKLSDVNMKIAVLDKVEKFIETGDKSGSIIPSTLGISDPVLSQLLEKLYNYELEYEKLKNTVAENNPILLTVKDQIKKIRPNIVQNIQSQRASLMAGKGNLSSTNGGYNSMLQAIPRKERELLEISREQSIKSNIYAFLLQKREESAISSAAAVSDVKVIDLAQSSSDPVSPNKKIVYLISFIAALAFVVGLITLREALNRTILYRKDIEALTDVTVIGEVSYQNVTNPIVVEDGKRTVIAEDFRKIRASLPFLGIGTNKKKILVTSSIPGEGKSFVAVNLAQTLALTGKKVVLVDMDLNKPSLGVIINSDAKNGVSEYLSNQTELEEIIRRTQVNENLFFVSAGALPPNPSELLSNGKVKSLIKYLENSFDYVIIDSAPTTPVSDAFLLTNYCDSTLFVIRHRYTPKMLIRRLDETIRINPLINTAIIFNGVRDRGFVKNNYGYGYGYVYKYSIDNANQKA
ncbi:MAG TPA: polysaccharide biosynthesis tyrosine autokinase, partial [Chitinophagaceae bacterium]|nr:polysaccharide biosynthesis tyrosine autokinase [Chitinophagaceae bacterium]